MIEPVDEKERADRLERELAEERETHKRHYAERDHYRESYFGEMKRAEVAEARVAELEAAHEGCGRRWGEDVTRALRERNDANYRADVAEERVIELETLGSATHTINYLKKSLELAEAKYKIAVIAGLTFEQAWAIMEQKGYQYGSDALEQVRFGWDLRGGKYDGE